jgi:hypothetical protein
VSDKMIPKCSIIFLIEIIRGKGVNLGLYLNKIFHILYFIYIL